MEGPKTRQRFAHAVNDARIKSSGGGVQVVNMDFLFDRLKPELVAFSVGNAGPDATTGQPHRCVGIAIPEMKFREGTDRVNKGGRHW